MSVASRRASSAPSSRLALPQYCAFHNGKHPLTPPAFETVVAFLRMIVDTVSGLSPTEGWLPMRAFLTPEAFQLFSRTYWAEQKRKGREGWEELLHPLA